MQIEKRIPSQEKKTAENGLKKQFRQFILDQDHPCVMAKSVFLNKKATLKDYGRMGTHSSAEKLYKDVKEYLRKYSFEDDKFESFIAVFSKQEIESELHFEEMLWKQLRLVKEYDFLPWDPEVSSDPNDEKFSFSVAGKAFYLVGMHPKSSRNARQTPYPCIVFNLHWQFERLRELGVYQDVKTSIRESDSQQNGSINPMLEDFGASSEARQYSGRAVEKGWKCPFSHLH